MKKNLMNQLGISLIELLVTLVISTLFISILYGAFNSTIKFNQKTQSNVNLRQEANIIINKLMQLHQGEQYNLCYDSLITNNNVTFDQIALDNNGIEINKINKCQNLNPAYNLTVQFTLADQQNNKFEVNTTIAAKNNVASNVNINIAYQNKQNFYSLLDNLFIYGKQFKFAGSQTNGSNATMVVTGNLLGSDINGGALSNVSNIYVNGYTDFSGGSAGLGSSTSPGKMYINGYLSLWDGTRDIYGDVYVNGDLKLKDARINGNIYVNGNVELGWTPTLGVNTKIYYTGSLTTPKNYDKNILTKVIKQSNVPGFTIPNYDIPSLKSDQWYSQNGYVVDDNKLGDNKKIYSKKNYSFTGKGSNVIIASTGDINIDDGWSGGVTGVLYAPNGKVTFNGDSFTGVVIAKNGFEVTSGGTIVTFTKINSFINNVSNYPF